MKNKLDILFKEKSHNLLMTHMVVGYPTQESSRAIAHALGTMGADIIEIQIPFSDPIADGPFIMNACEEALKHNVTVNDAFTLCRELAHADATPLVIMTYGNIVYSYGITEFVRHAKKNGISALIVPDIPYDSPEGVHLQEVCTKEDMYFIYVISTNMETLRLQPLLKKAKGFLYCTSKQGTTGLSGSFNPHLESFIKRVGRHSVLPIAVGFGIATQKDVSYIHSIAPIAVIGSAFIKEIEHSSLKPAEAVSKFLRIIKAS